MIFIICFIFLLLSFIELAPNRFFPVLTINGIRLTSEFYFFIFAVLLFLIAAFRGEKVDRDYSIYIQQFNIYKDTWNGNYEPTFKIISRLVKSVFDSNFSVLIIIYAVFGISTKVLAIKQLSEFWILSLLIYISYLFTLHEMTQIRAGVSAGFMMLSIKPLYERRIFRFLLFVCIAISFHYSAFISIFFWFLNAKKINKYFYLSLIPASYVIHFLTLIDSEFILKFLSNGPILKKFLAYQFLNNDYINVFNSWQILKILIAFILIFNIDEILAKNRYSIILIKLYIFSICSYVFFAFNPAFATRLSDLFSISEIILIPCILYFVKPEIYAKFIVIFIGFAYLFLNLFYNIILS
jgi:hypothetical protein